MHDSISHDALWEAERLRFGPVPISAYPVVPGGKRPVRNLRPGEFKECLDYQTLLPFGDIRRRFDRREPPNLAVICGPPSSGLAVLDFDAPGAFAEFEAEFPRFVADSPVVRTRRGFHVGVLLDSRAPPLLNGPTTFGDLKTKGGFALWPPSTCGGFRRSYIRHPCDVTPKVLQGKMLRWLVDARSNRCGGDVTLYPSKVLNHKEREGKLLSQTTNHLPNPISLMGRSAAVAAARSLNPVLALCGRLQLAHGGGQFFLSRRHLMHECGLPDRAARRALADLLETGLLVLVQAGTRGPGGRAAYYRIGGQA